MNRQEHLLTILGEEGVEVAQRCTKALRFGLSEIQPGQELTNAQRIRGEYIDLLAVMRMLVEDGAIEPVTDDDLPVMEQKRQKVEKFLVYSRECGTLTDESDYQRGYDAGVSDGLDSAAEDAAGASM